MNIVETKIYALGRFMIRQQPMFDNPAFGHYLIFLDGDLIGKQLSVPTISDAEWHLSKRGEYAKAEESRQDFRKYGRAHYPSAKRGRPTNAERARRDAALLTEIPE